MKTPPNLRLSLNQVRDILDNAADIQMTTRRYRRRPEPPTTLMGRHLLIPERGRWIPPKGGAE